MTQASKALRITLGRGFQMTFANGWTVSVQFGPGNYCDNRSYNVDLWDRQHEIGAEGCNNAEVAAWDAQGVWYDFGSDTVKGWLSPDEIAAFIQEIAEKENK